MNEPINRKSLIFEISQTLKRKRKRKFRVIDNNPMTGATVIEECDTFALADDLTIEIIHDKEQIETE